MDAPLYALFYFNEMLWFWLLSQWETMYEMTSKVPTHPSMHSHATNDELCAFGASPASF